MSGNFTIYHYPKCSTSNAALAFLRSKNIEPKIILYCDTGLAKEEVCYLMRLLSLEKPSSLIKKNGLTYRHLGLAHKNLSDEEMLDTIIQNPKLLQRPIIICGDRAIIGKNEDTIAKMLQNL